MTSLGAGPRKRFADRRRMADSSPDRFRIAAWRVEEAPSPVSGAPSLTRKVQPSGPLRLTLFGGPELRVGELVIPLSPLQGAMLGVLAAHGGRGVPHARLLAFLWPEGADAKLRPRLNQLVYTLHERIGGERLIRRAGGSYLLGPDQSTSDLETFFTALSDGQATTAADLVTRGFLPGIGVPPTVELERWIRERELRFRADVRTLATERWAVAEQRGDWPMAEVAAETLMRLSPEDEGLLRRLLQAKALGGKVREARVAYQGYCEVLQVTQPDWKPSGDTVTLVERLEELAARGRGTVPIRAAGPDREPALVGREPELARLQELFRHPPPRPHVVVVSGEGGIGKTRLVREALGRAPLEGVRVLSSACSEFEAGIPMGAVLRALTPEWVGREIRDLPAPWGPILLSLLPEFDAEGGAEGRPYAGATEEIQRVTCEAFLQLFHQLARTDPVVLFLDDFHWVDPTSLAVLQYLLGRRHGRRFVLILTVRPEAMAAGGGPHRWLARLDTPPHLPDFIPLGPLADRETEALIRAILAEGAGAAARPDPGQAREPVEAEDLDRTRHPPPDVEKMLPLLGGHPLLALEYVRHWMETSNRVSSEHPEARIPEAVRAIVARRTAELPPASRKLLTGAAPSDRPLPYSVVGAAAGLSQEELPEALDAALDRRLLVVSPRGVEFRHGLFREAVLGTMTEGARAAMHLRIARALIELGEASLEIDIALHLLRGGDGVRARPFVLRAARRAIESGGWSEAGNLLDAALRGDAPPAERAVLAGLHGRVLVLSGEFSAGAARWKEAEDAHRAAGEDREALTCRLRALEAGALAPASRREELLADLRGLRQEAAERHYQELVADCMGVEIAMLDRLGRIAEVRHLTEEASLWTTDVGVDAELSFLFVAMVDAVYGAPAKATAISDRALELARSQDRPDLALKVINWRLIALYQQARLNLDEGKEVIAEGLRLLRLSQEVEARYKLEANIGVWYMDTGDYAAAGRALARAEQVLSGLPAPHLRRTLIGNRGQLFLEIGDPLSARTHFQQSLTEMKTSPWGAHQRMALAGIALTHLHEGQLGEARRVFAELPARPESWTSDPYLWLALEARMGLASGIPVGRVLERLREEEAELLTSVATAWVRLRILRFEIGFRRDIRPDRKEVQELHDFLEHRRIPLRLSELHRLLERFGWPP